MEMFQLFQQCFLVLLTIAIGWFACIILCSSVTVQRHVFYLHKLPIWWSQKLDIPESFGFLPNQILPLRIRTADEVSLYAWLVTPLALYSRHQDEFLRQEQRKQDESDVAIKLLGDSKSQLIIYFHGNAGTVGQTRRTEAYRSIASGLFDRAHVLAFDYRGFGRSTGRPDEKGLTTDALSVIRWAITVGKVPTERIMIVAQSLGTAVATAAVEAMLKEAPHTRFAGLCMCAAFSDAPSVFASYRVGGHIPVLYPLKMLPSLDTWFSARVEDKWPTKQRLVNIFQKSRSIRLVLLAATCDEIIPWQNTEDIFSAIVDQIEIDDHTMEQQTPDSLDLREGGEVEQWTKGDKVLRKVLVRYGGHNGIMKWNPVALEVYKTLS